MLAVVGPANAAVRGRQRRRARTGLAAIDMTFAGLVTVGLVEALPLFPGSIGSASIASNAHAKSCHLRHDLPQRQAAFGPR
jgi:hypothetical protein